MNQSFSTKHPDQKFPVAVSIAAIVSELEGAASWLERNNVKVDDSLVEDLVLRVYFIQPKTKEQFFLLGTFDNYKLWPPIWDWYDQDWSNNDGKHLSPARASTRGPMFYEDYDRDKGIICAPFSRLAYGIYGGPHGDWSELDRWDKIRNPNIVHADTIGDMLQLINYDLEHSVGRMGPFLTESQLAHLHQELIATVQEAIRALQQGYPRLSTHQIYDLYIEVKLCVHRDRNPMRREQVQDALSNLEQAARNSQERPFRRISPSPQYLVQRVQAELSRSIEYPSLLEPDLLEVLLIGIMRSEGMTRVQNSRKKLRKAGNIVVRMGHIASMQINRQASSNDIRRMLTELLSIMQRKPYE